MSDKKCVDMSATCPADCRLLKWRVLKERHIYQNGTKSDWKKRRENWESEETAWFIATNPCAHIPCSVFCAWGPRSPEDWVVKLIKESFITIYGMIYYRISFFYHKNPTILLEFNTVIILNQVYPAEWINKTLITQSKETTAQVCAFEYSTSISISLELWQKILLSDWK